MKHKDSTKGFTWEKIEDSYDEEGRDVSQDQPPYANAGIFTLITVSWISPILKKIYHGKFEADRHLWACAYVDRSDKNSLLLSNIWQEELASKGRDGASFFRVILRYGKSTIVVIVITSLISSMCSFLTASFCVNYLLEYADGKINQIGIGVSLMLAMAIGLLVRIIAMSFSLMKASFLASRLRNGAMAMLYKKVLRLQGSGDGTTGKIINTLATDMERLARGMMLTFPALNALPLLISAAAYATYLMGPISLLATGVFIAQLLFVGVLARKLGSYRRKAAAISDKRLKSIAEILCSIKLIKIYTWEQPFLENIFGLRKQEVSELSSLRITQSILLMSSAYALAFAQIVSIVALVLLLGVVTPVQAFTLVSVLNQMKLALDMLPSSLRAMADLVISCKRIKSVMLLDEFVPPKIITDGRERAKYCLTFRKASFGHTVCSRTEDNDERNAKHLINGDTKKNYGTLHKAKTNGTKNGISEKKPLNNVTVNKSTGMTFTYLPALSNLDFKLERGEVIGICGAIGTGKTSLLQAILGRIQLLSGSYEINGRLAYVPQEAWLNNATLKDNILFGNEYDRERYHKCMEVCCLQDDINILPAGDLTEIGERGINLSGGQKQRVSLARAVYSDRDLYLLDDPLSAVDNRVGSTIFSHCIQGALRGKSVLLVTHQVRFLSRCDKVIYMKSTGMVANKTHGELMESDLQYRDMILSVETDQTGKTQHGQEKEVSSDETSKKIELKAGDVEQTVAVYVTTNPGWLIGALTPPLYDFAVDGIWPRVVSGNLTIEETIAHGDLKWSTVNSYVKASGGYFSFVGMVFIVTLNVCSQSFPAWWLGIWLENDYLTSEGNCTASCEDIDIRSDPNFEMYISVFAASPFMIIVCGVIGAFIIAKMTYKAANYFHNSLLKTITRATMTFFDTTPVGQLQNRFSTDMDQLDSFLSTTLEMLLYFGILIIVIVSTIIVSSPLVATALLPCTGIFYYVWIRSKSGVRDLKRQDMASRSPLYSLITSTIQGLTTINAFDKTEDFTQKFCALLDRFHVRQVTFSFVGRWTGFRLDMVFLILVSAITVVIVVVPLPQTASQSGLALSFALQLSNLLFIVVLFTNDIIGSFTSVERLDHYIKNVPQEASAIVETFCLDQLWPEYGQILFHDFCMRYQPHQPRVLKNLSFRVDPRQRIGIVGRTGAGKSSLMVALFRLVEKEAGNIFIDGLDISKIGLQDLRRHMSMIPQDPVLFSGTVRYNIDPFNEWSDDDVWDALEKCHLKDKIASTSGGLQDHVTDGGSNFSLGERQLICLARALLSHCRILLLDEATASVDPQTDTYIQEAIRTAFPECTMLIIAHRINTVLDCDKILVMDGGQVAEYDTPENLLANPNSVFKQLLAASYK